MQIKYVRILHSKFNDYIVYTKVGIFYGNWCIWRIGSQSLCVLPLYNIGLHKKKLSNVTSQPLWLFNLSFIRSKTDLRNGVQLPNIRVKRTVAYIAFYYLYLRCIQQYNNTRFVPLSLIPISSTLYYLHVEDKM